MIFPIPERERHHVLLCRLVGRRQVSTSAYTRSPTVPASVNTAPYVETVDVQLSRDALPISSFNRYRALVLDTSYRPIDIVNWQRAICLDLFDKASIQDTGGLELNRQQFHNFCSMQVDVLEYYDALVHSARAEFMIPAVLRVRMYVQRDNRGRISLTRRNLLLRDSSTCQ